MRRRRRSNANRPRAIAEIPEGPTLPLRAFSGVVPLIGGTFTPPQVRQTPASAMDSYARAVISTAHGSRLRDEFQQEFLAT